MTLNGYFALNSVFALTCLASDSATVENNYVKLIKIDTFISGYR